MADTWGQAVQSPRFLERRLSFSNMSSLLWKKRFKDVLRPIICSSLRWNLPGTQTGRTRIHGIRDFKIQRRGRDESRPEVKIPKMTTTAHDRDVNKPRPCSRRTRWRPFWRCWQTVSIWTYFDCELALFVCISKLNYPGYIPHVFVFVLFCFVFF